MSQAKKIFFAIVVKDEEKSEKIKKLIGNWYRNSESHIFNSWEQFVDKTTENRLLVFDAVIGEYGDINFENKSGIQNALQAKRALAKAGIWFPLAVGLCKTILAMPLFIGLSFTVVNYDSLDGLEDALRSYLVTTGVIKKTEKRAKLRIR